MLVVNLDLLVLFRSFPRVDHVNAFLRGIWELAHEYSTKLDRAYFVYQRGPAGLLPMQVIA